ncbi:hypothetical protein [Burkholderia sp. LMU1-1-1.1]|uniref:hypothetical protein n=1 Tax=Burkholderia sp. LMU1-1-1.1 TaxID=3135266 RepID=UPI003428D49B
MSKNATIKAGNGFRSNTLPHRDLHLTSPTLASGMDLPWLKGSAKGLLSKTKASLSIENRTVSISVEIPIDLQSELLEAFSEKLKIDFIKNLLHVAALPSNFRTPFLKKKMEREDFGYGTRSQRVYLTSDFCSDISALHIPYQAAISQRSSSKATQLSIGLTTSIELYQLIEGRANSRNESVNKIASELFSCGLDELNSRLHDEDDEHVFADFENFNNNLQNPTTRRWMLRIDRRLYNRTSLLAQEFGKSLAQIALLCIAHSLGGSGYRDKPKKYFTHLHAE